MNPRTLIRRLLSPAGFGLVFIFFLLPLVTVSCGSGDAQVQSTFNGATLLVGGEPKVTGPNVTADAARQLIDVFSDSLVWQPLIALAVVAVLAGFVVGFVRRSVVQHGASLALAVVACGLLVAELRTVPGQVSAALSAVSADGTKLAAPVGWTVHVRYGFWLATATLVLLAAVHASALVRLRQAPPSVRNPDPGRAADPDPGLDLLGGHREYDPEDDLGGTPAR